jgi:hypothetical protein
MFITILFITIFPQVSSTISGLVSSDEGGVVEPQTAVDTLEANLSIINFTDKIILEQGYISFFIARINNTGKRILTNTSLSILEVPRDISYSIDPESIDIPINESQNFIVKFKTPLEVIQGYFPVIFNVSSGNVYDSKIAFLEVIQNSTVFTDIIRIKDIRLSKFFVGENGEIKIIVENEGTMPLNVKAYIYAPENLIAKDNVISKTITPSDEEDFSFIISSNQTGTFTIKIVILSNGEEIKEDIILNVYSVKVISTTEFLLWFFIILAIFVLILFLINKIIRGEKTRKYSFKETLYNFNKSLRPFIQILYEQILILS